MAAEPRRVRDVLVDLERYPRWWREVRAVARLSDDDALVVCRSALPYDLELHLHAVHRHDDLLETGIDGDLVGHARYRISPHGAGTRLHFEQDVDVSGRLLGLASRLARPVLVWNHDRMMRSCLSGLRSAV
ncbi:SRPBCC family protein [Nocardioides guangzhouensis]|uniref:SRPBCC family protein n=1 Tax=Nocardioides guangzhouensis TaxID=2497878 RepID=UPI001FE3066D|nr:SRPBCC family protein [Nocardioides guangzhouensis]